MDMNYKKKTIVFANIISAIIIIFVFYAVFYLLLYGDNNTVTKIIQSDSIIHSLKLSLFTSISAVLFSFIFALPFAYILANYDFKLKNIIDVLINIPIFLPPILLGIIILIILNNFPVINNLDIIYTPVSIFFVQFVVALPFMIKTFKNGFESISSDFGFVAQTLGFSKLKSIFTVELPLVKKSIYTGILLGWCRAVGDFGGTLIIGGAISNYTQTLPVVIYLKLSTGLVDVAIYLSLFMIVVISCIFLILKKV